MVFLDVAFVGLVIGKLLGGRVAALGETKIVATWLVFIAIGLQMIAFPWSFLPWTTPSSVARAIWLFPAPGGPTSRRKLDAAGSCMSRSASASASTRSP